MTVSRVIARSPNVNENTRNLVLQTMREMNYRPEKVARLIEGDSRRKKVIALLSENIMRPERSEIVRSVEKQLSKNGYLLTLCETGENAYRQDEYLRYVMDETSISGVIVVSGLIDQKKLAEFIKPHRHKPLVSINWSGTWALTDSVVPDVYRSVLMAVDYLYSRGHRDIAFINSPLNATGAFEGRMGYLDAMQGKGLEANEEYIFEGTMEKESGSKIAREVVSAAPQVTAVICSNLSMASGFADEMGKMGKSVPEDVSIILSGITVPRNQGYSFSSIGASYDEAGIEAVNNLLERIKELEEDGEMSLNNRRVILEPHLYEEQTVRFIQQGPQGEG